ncbi:MULTISPECIES: hypothetical protein [Streptomyces]|uniref:hypothetical protein n=1 Tax=Streptomyces lycopersici TaxID=2974589 RepID=UPI003523E7FE
MGPTRNAWVPLAAWFQHRGTKVVLVPPEQSADLRDYYHKHTRNDRPDSRVLARLPLLRPRRTADLRVAVPDDSILWGQECGDTDPAARARGSASAGHHAQARVAGPCTARCPVPTAPTRLARTPGRLSAHPAGLAPAPGEAEVDAVTVYRAAAAVPGYPRPDHPSPR